MMKNKWVLGLLLGFSLVSCAHEVNPWRLVQDPSAGEAHIYGFVTSGCIAGAESLADSADFSAMRPSRHRYYAHPMTKKYITEFARAFYAKEHEFLLVGDAAQPRGGPFGAPGNPSSHNSHQTGLDVDIWYNTSANRLGGQDLENVEAVSLVKPDGETMSENWNYDHVAMLLKTAASFAEVERIFVNPAIKRELCVQSRMGSQASRKGATKWLHKIRPWYGHDDHFHVRLVCPKNENCRSFGDELSAGDGCDESLNWWFSAEAKAKAKEKAPVFRMPRLPAECAKILPQPLPVQ